MTGIERLRELAETLLENIGDMQLNSDSEPLWRIVTNIADQIAREHAEDCFRMGERAAEDAEAIAWVREHGGIAYVRDAWNVRSNLDRQLEKAQAKVERQQRHIESVQAKCRERQEHICELNKLKRAYIDALNGICKRLGLTDGTGLPDMPEVIWTELDRRLMPEGMEWPRVDGEPVVIGERLVGYGSGDDGYEVVGVRPTCGWVLVKSCEHIHRDGGAVILEWDASKCHRPAPKALDADGVETRVGDTVWHVLGEFGPRVVSKFETHDGRPVAVFEPNGSDLRGCECDQLTHERPDSLDRLAEDIGAMVVAWRSNQDLFDAQEAAAGCVGENTLGAALDSLVRRAKALAERDA